MSASESETQNTRAAALTMEARILQRREQPVRALRKYQRAWRLDRQARPLLKQIVPLAIELGRVAEGTRYALLLANSDLADPFLAERVAMLLSDQLEYDRSLQLYKHVLQLRAQEPASRDPVAMHFEMGRLYFLTEKYQQASQSFRVVLDALDNPNQPLSKEVRDAIFAEPKLTYQLIAETFLEAGEYDDARTMFMRAFAQEPSDFLQLQLARVDYRAGRYQQSRQNLENYVTQKLQFGGQTPYELLGDVLERLRRGIQPGDAEETVIGRFQQWLANDPENIDLLSFVADLTRRRGVLIDAASLYEKLLSKEPTIEAYQGLVTVYRELGDGNRLLEAMGRVSEEINSLEPFADDVQAIIKDRDFLATLFRIGREKLKSDVTLGKSIGLACGLLALNAKDYQAAEEFFDSVETRSVDLSITWGIELMMAEENERAVAVFSAALRETEDANTRAVLLYYLSGAQQLLGETNAALTAAREAVRLRGDMPDFAVRPAWILFNAERFAEAEAAYTQWLATYGEDYSLPGIRETVREARFVMSSICSEGGRIAEAAEYLERVLDEFPEDVSVMNDLGYLFADHGLSLERATHMIKRAVDAEPDNSAYRDSLGWAYYRQGAYAKAVEQLVRAAADPAPDPIVLDHLAEAYRAAGNADKAIRTWQRALELLKSHPEDPLGSVIEQKLAANRVESK